MESVSTVLTITSLAFGCTFIYVPDAEAAVANLANLDESYSLRINERPGKFVVILRGDAIRQACFKSIIGKQTCNLASVSRRPIL